MGARVLSEPRRGYGRACLTGLAAADAPDVVVFLDGDYSDRPDELPLLLAPIVEGRADITIGSRLGEAERSGALPWHQAFGNRLAAGSDPPAVRSEDHRSRAFSRCACRCPAATSICKRQPMAGRLR